MASIIEIENSVVENRACSRAYISDLINSDQASGHIIYRLQNAEVNFNDMRKRQIASTIEITEL